jgi:hypothetical protein
VQERLWEARAQDDPAAARLHLDTAIVAYERGFYLRNDYYNGINFAFLLNLRASLSTASLPDAIADFVQARRVRARLIDLCLPMADAALTRAESRRAPGAPPDEPSAALEQDYWVVATLAEAWAGLEDEHRAAESLADVEAFPLPAGWGWMKETTRDQINKLRKLVQDSPLKQLR